MHSRGLSYRAVRDLLEIPQDTSDYAALVRSMAARRVQEMGS